MKNAFLGLAILLCSILSFSIFAQKESSKLPSFQMKNGLHFTAADSSFSVNMRFRMQNRLAFTSLNNEDLSLNEAELRVRRLRLRFDGFVFDPKFSYYIQLSFSRADQDWDDSGVPNVVRDAVFYYQPNKHWKFGVGQTKLPGNRQRVVSSGELQFADRSIVNANLTWDRDAGLFITYTNHLGKVHYNLKSAITSGEGRNSNKTDNGLSYTGRIEILPFGLFTNNGSYFEGDLAREKTPKLELAVAYNYNDKAIRTRGQLGKSLYQARTFEGFNLDGVFKYHGWAFTSEYIQRLSSQSPFTTDANGNTSYAYLGKGLNNQLSYINKKNIEFAGRYSILTPDESIRTKENQIQHYTLGLTKYFRQHRFKLQSNLTYEARKSYKNGDKTGNYNLTFQVEIGI
jgi:phosphate-selective porin OprO/OprP